MKTIITLAVAIIFWVNGFAQVTFQKTFGGVGNESAISIKQSADGGYYILGTTNSFGAGGKDIYLLKADADGNLLWAKTFGGALDDSPTKLILSNDGNLIIAAVTNSFGAGSSDVYLIKADSDGNLIWSKTFGGIDVDFIRDILQTSDSGFILAGQVNFSTSTVLSYVIRTNANGDTLWTRAYGGMGTEWLTSVQSLSDGSYLLAGGLASFVSSMIVRKIDSQGNLLWSKEYNDGRNHTSPNIIINSSGDIFIANGRFSPGIHHAILTNLDTSGNVLWLKAFGGGNVGKGNVILTTDGGFLFSGSYGAHQHHDACLIKCNSMGDVVMTKLYISPYPHYQIAQDVIQTSDGGIAMAGTTYYYGSGGSDIYFIKTDANGNSGCNDTNLSSGSSNDFMNVTNYNALVSQPSTLISVPNTITGTGCIATTVCYAVGISDTRPEKDVFSLSPNPATTEITITPAASGAETKIVSVEIYDVLGKEISKVQMAKGKNKIDVTKLYPGIYFVKIKTETGERVAKFVKQ